MRPGVVEKAMWVMVALLACLTLAALSGCDDPCKDGDQQIRSTGDVYLCVDGVWERQDNPNPRDPIEALGERVLVVR